MTVRPRPAKTSGFTLVELLVGLALTGVAALLLLEVMGVGRTAARRNEARASAVETVTTAQDMLRGRIELLTADTGTGADAAHGTTEGDAAHFAFVAPAFGNDVGGGLVRYHVALDPHGALDLATTDARDTAASGAHWRMLPLIAGVRAIEWSYYGKGTEGGASLWQTSWQGRDDPPQLVRLRLRFDAGDARGWPDLVVQPAATVSTACDLDPTTNACRTS